MHRLRAAETGDIEAMTDLLLRHGPNPWNHLPEEGVRAHLRAIADGREGPPLRGPSLHLPSAPG